MFINLGKKTNCSGLTRFTTAEVFNSKQSLFLCNGSRKHCKARQPQHLHRSISAAFPAWHFVPFAVSQAHPNLGFRPTAIPKVSNSPVLSCKASNLSPRSATFVILSCIVSIVSSICDWIAWIYMSTWSANYPFGRCHNPIRSPRTGVPSAQGKRTRR